MPIQHLLILLCGVKTNIMFANLSVISSVLKCVSLQVLYVINVIKAYVFELSWMYIIGLLSYFLNKSIFKLLNFNIVYSQNFTSPLLCILISKIFLPHLFVSKLIKPRNFEISALLFSKQGMCRSWLLSWLGFGDSKSTWNQLPWHA